MIIANTPTTSQLHERISSNARAQRRALIEPIPSQMNATARTPYMQMLGSTVNRGIWPPGPFADIALAKNIKGTNKAHRQPNPIVKIPNTTSPVERS